MPATPATARRSGRGSRLELPDDLQVRQLW